ncbi:serine protease [Longispora sp. NPDC051575]|uniref:serine protease n=1 Tax=Longispora sp. NPDC051575 TaxID=3154943 RepID=UPI003419B59C
MSGAGRVPLEAALVRVWNGDTSVGAGFLAGPRHLLTAAHVVASALGTPPDGPPPTEHVLVDFPLLAPGVRCAAEVVAWSPVGADLTGDVAGLRLLGPPPEGARPLVLTRYGGLSDDQLVMVGFPRGLEIGSWIYGRPGGPVATGWVEIESDPARGATIERGFSGAPVWHPGLDAVVGMVVRKVGGAPPKIGYMIPVGALLAAWPEVERVIERASPFRALRPFTERDAGLYFGREDQAARIVRRVRAGTAAICVTGPTGVGKSSLLAAGVLPGLRAGPGAAGAPGPQAGPGAAGVPGSQAGPGAAGVPGSRVSPGAEAGPDSEVAVVVLRPSDGSTPLRALAFALGRLTGSDPFERLAAGGTADVVAEILDGYPAERLLVAVDQFEELFGYPAEEQAAFTAALGSALRPGARFSVLVALADTFRAAASTNPAVAELAARWLPVTLGELTTTELRRAVTGPLATIGTVDYETGLVDRILDDVQSAPSSLPLLQFALTQLWERRRGGLLTHEAFDELGGVRGALAGYAEDVWDGLEPAARLAARRLLVQLVRPLPDGDLSVRRTARRDELDEDQWTIAQRLATGRLLVLRSAPEVGVELAHESLVVEWDRLHGYATRYREFRLWQENLRQRRAQWTAEDGAARRLLSSVELRDARHWEDGHGADLAPAERHFLQLSRNRRRGRRARWAFALVVALVASVVGYGHLRGQVAESSAIELTRNAAQLRLSGDRDGYGALQLALRAFRTHPDVTFEPGSFSEDFEGVDTLLPGRAVRDGDLPQQVSADGRTMVLLDAGKTPHVMVWDVHARRRLHAAPLAALFHPLDAASQPVISRSGRYIAFVQWVAPVYQLGPVDAEGLPKQDPKDFPTCKVPHAATAVTCLVVYDLSRGRIAVAAPMGGLFAHIRSISIDRDDQSVGVVVAGDLGLAPKSSTNTLERWDLGSGQRREPVGLPWRSWVHRLWLEPGGAFLDELLPNDAGTAPGSSALSFADLAGDGPLRVPLADRTTGAAASLDGGTVAARVPLADGFAELRTWRTASRAPGGPVTGLSREESRGALALSPDGSVVLSAWQRGVGALATATDIRTVDIGGVAVSGWNTAGGARIPGEPRFSGYWSALLPLAEGPDAPVLLLGAGIVGAVLPGPGLPAPLRRLTSAERDAPKRSAAFRVDRLCALMVEPNEDGAARRKNVPSGAYQGPVCP